MLNATVVSLKRHGKAENVNHEPPIENEDLLWLRSFQGLIFSNPLSFLRNVCLHIVFPFCRRGRVGPRTLKTTSFKIEVDPTGRNYATMVHDKATKNHPGGIADVPSSEKPARMYETDGVKDSYKALTLHISSPFSNIQLSRKELEFRREHLV